MGIRENAKSTDMSEVLPEEVEVKEAAETFMGTEISEEDITNIKHLCQQVIEIQEYRGANLRVSEELHVGHCS